MKIVVQIEPDAAEKILDGIEQGDFIVDQEAYGYFLNEIFIKGIKRFVENVAPGEWKEMEGLTNAEKVNAWYDNQDIISKHHHIFNEQRQKFYLYRNEIYTYNFIGFLNVGNVIQLVKLEMEDIIRLLND